MGERRVAYRALIGRAEERCHLEDLGIEGIILIKWTFEKFNVAPWTGLMWITIGTRWRAVVNEVMNCQLP